MSRAHLVDWMCDRCGMHEMVRAKSDAKLPDGWFQTGSLPSVDLCGECHKAFANRFHDFLNELRPHSGHQPTEPTGKGTEDVLHEMDPEVDDGDH